MANGNEPPPKFNNKPLVEHEVIQRVLKASYRANPPRARYSFTWDVEPLLMLLQLFFGQVWPYGHPWLRQGWSFLTQGWP